EATTLASASISTAYVPGATSDRSTVVLAPGASSMAEASLGMSTGPSGPRNVMVADTADPVEATCRVGCCPSRPDSSAIDSTSLGICRPGTTTLDPVVAGCRVSTPAGEIPSRRCCWISAPTGPPELETRTATESSLGASPATNSDCVCPGARVISEIPDSSTGPSAPNTARFTVELVSEGFVTVRTEVVPVVVVAPVSQCWWAAGVQAAVVMPARSPSVAAYWVLPAASPGVPPTGSTRRATG